MKRNNLNITKIEPLLSPLELKTQLPISKKASDAVANYRQTIKNIMDRKDKRFLVIVGPCSIHSPQEAIEYASRLASLNNTVQDKLMLIMRVYFEKPRTTTGWKGLIYDPDLNESYNMAKGLYNARQLLLKINEIGLPTATEILDPVTAQYIADLISWAAIGARTTESQTHRQLASGLSMPVGFKNTTDGSIKTAIEAIQAAIHKHAFLGVLEDGRNGIFYTKGNKYAHMVLRGGSKGANYSSEFVAYTRELLKRLNITPNIIIDCSHANSNKEALKQKKTLMNVVNQKKAGEQSIIGVMLESNLLFGKQTVKEDTKPKYGISITDECLGWEETEKLLKDIFRLL